MRDAGAVPATIGLVDGVLRVGLTEAELERFARAGAEARKVGPRDVAACLAQKALGATTVGGTLAACRRGGHRLHGHRRPRRRAPGLRRAARRLRRPRRAAAGRGAASSRSGVKSLLDVPATAELLETLGIPVLGYRTDTLPLFYQAERRPAGLGPGRVGRGGGPRSRARPLVARPPLGAAAGPAARREPGRRGPLIAETLEEADARGRARPGRDAVRARPAARALRRPNAAGQPRPDRGQRRRSPARSPWPSPGAGATARPGAYPAAA